jgi:hypothetical protein
VSEPKLRLYTDQLSPSASFGPLRNANRAIYVCEGKIIVRCAGVAVSLAENCAWQGPAGPTITAGPSGARLLRWELSHTEPEAAPPGNDVQSRLTLEAEPRLQPGLDYLMRCDRVDFPPGGLAWTHTHKGPGIRCLQSGRIRIETQGHDFWVEPGEAWFETGVDPVFAETRPDGPSHFLRVMILPRSIRGKSSITYVKPEDQDKPKTQSYQVFVDEPIELNQS